MRKSKKRLCMMCEKKPLECINLEFKKDNGEVIPVTINGVKYNSLDLCLDCMIATQVMIAKTKISEMNVRSGHE